MNKLIIWFKPGTKRSVINAAILLVIGYVASALYYLLGIVHLDILFLSLFWVTLLDLGLMSGLLSAYWKEKRHTASAEEERNKSIRAYPIISFTYFKGIIVCLMISFFGVIYIASIGKAFMNSEFYYISFNVISCAIGGLVGYMITRSRLFKKIEADIEASANSGDIPKD